MKAQPPRDPFFADLFWLMVGSATLAWVLAEWLARACPANIMNCV